ncbi:MAG: hypothetical protein KBF28_11175 [Gemmatimonadales bacterium]|nr:hypothetical protein [Gemmatimonadales bacterium]
MSIPSEHARRVREAALQVIERHLEDFADIEPDAFCVGITDNMLTYQCSPDVFDPTARVRRVTIGIIVIAQDVP